MKLVIHIPYTSSQKLLFIRKYFISLDVTMRNVSNETDIHFICQINIYTQILSIFYFDNFMHNPMNKLLPGTKYNPLF